MIDRTHDPEIRSWVESANDPACDFPVQNLPFVTYSPKGESLTRAGVAIGDQLLDLGPAFGVERVFDLMAMRREKRADLRRAISDFLIKRAEGADAFLTPMDAADLRLPCTVRDYTDFYASI